jgi:hypothetical protein
MIHTGDAIAFLLGYYSINLIYSLNENGLYFFRTSKFRKETGSFFAIALIMAFFFS